MVRTAVVLEEMRSFLSGRCLEEPIAWTALARLVLQLLQLPADEHQTRKLARDMRKFLDEGRLAEIGDGTSATRCSLRFLRPIVNHFAQATVDDDDVAKLFSELRDAKLTQPKRSITGAASSSQPSASSPSGVPDASCENIAERLTHWHGFTETDLKLTLLTLEDQSAAKDDQIAELKEQLRNSDRKLQRMEDKHKNRDDELKQLRAQAQFRGGKGKHISKVGGYTLAASRAQAHVGAGVLAKIVGGAKHQGEVQDAHTVIQYEHKMATAKNVRSMQEYQSWNGEGDIEFHEIKSDSTHEFSQISKVHVCKVSSSMANMSQCIKEASPESHGHGDEHATELNVDALSRCVRSMTLSADLQEVTEGTGQELYNMHLKELASVGCPTWEARIAESTHPEAPEDGILDASDPDARPSDPDARRRLAVYSFGLDAGPENIGFGGRLRRACLGIVNVWFIIIFCMMHQAHLIVKNILKALDDWQWPTEENGEPEEETEKPSEKTPSIPASYFNGVAAISSIWRSVGHPRKILKAARDLFGEDVAITLFGKIPGRVMRGRWLSIEGIEQIVLAAHLYIGAVFMALWHTEAQADDANEEAAETGRKKRKLKKGREDDKQLGTEDDQNFIAKQRRYKNLSTRLVNCKLFFAMIAVSVTVKAVIVHFMLWVQKNVKIHKKAQKDATDQRRSYLGPTPLSQLVTGKATELTGDLNGMLEHDISSPSSPFYCAYQLVPVGMVKHLRRLVATVVLITMCSWTMRFAKKAASLPLELVWLVEKPPHEVHRKRMEVAGKLLASTDDELERQAPFTDIPSKLKKMYPDELKHVVDTGCCPVNLYITVLLLRSRMAYETQDLEGWNSIIQFLTNGVFNKTRLPLTSDRLKNKVGDAISPQECADLHKMVQDHMLTQAHWQRFQPALAPVPEEMHPRRIAGPIIDLSKRFERAIIKEHGDKGLTVGYTFERTLPGQVIRPGFLMAWPYSWRFYVVKGNLEAKKLDVAENPAAAQAAVGSVASIDEAHVQHVFHIILPLQVSILTDVVQEVLEKKPLSDKLDLWQYTISWDAMRELPIKEETHLSIKPAKEKRGKAAKAKAKSKSRGKQKADDRWLEEMDPEEVGLEAGHNEDDDHDVNSEADIGNLDPEEIDEDGHEKPTVDTVHVDKPGRREDEKPEQPDDDQPPLLPILDTLTYGESGRVVQAIAQVLAAGATEVNRMMREVSNANKKRPQQGNISLVRSIDGNCSFVFWRNEENARSLLGQAVTIDHWGRIVFIVAHQVPYLDYSKHSIIIPDTGGVMFKAKANLRADMPLWALRMRWHHELQAYSGPFTSQTLHEQSKLLQLSLTDCVVCSGAAKYGYDQKGRVDYLASECEENPYGISPDALFVCRSCHSPFHAVCACAQVFRHFGLTACSFDSFNPGMTFECPVCA